MKVKISYRNGRCIATIPLRLQNGRTIVIRRGCSLAAVRRALANSEPAQVSGFFGDIGRAVKSVAKSSAIRTAVSAASQAAKNPIVQSVLPPQATMALRAAGTASKLIGIAKSGSPAAPKAKAVLQASLIAAKREKSMPRRRVQAIKARQLRSPTGRAFRYLVTVAPAT